MHQNSVNCCKNLVWAWLPEISHPWDISAILPENVSILWLSLNPQECLLLDQSFHFLHTHSHIHNIPNTTYWTQHVVLPTKKRLWQISIETSGMISQVVWRLESLITISAGNLGHFILRLDISLNCTALATNSYNLRWSLLI